MVSPRHQRICERLLTVPPRRHLRRHRHAIEALHGGRARAPVDALDRGRPRLHVHPERRAAPRLDGMLRHGKSLPCLRHGGRADRSPDNSIVTDCPTHVAQKASSMRGLSLSRAAVPVSGLGHTVSHANWRSVTSLGNCQKKFAQHREALHHSKPVTEAHGTLYPIAV